MTEKTPKERVEAIEASLTRLEAELKSQRESLAKLQTPSTGGLQKANLVTQAEWLKQEDINRRAVEKLDKKIKVLEQKTS